MTSMSKDLKLTNQQVSHHAVLLIIDIITKCARNYYYFDNQSPE